jgi:hypothetical protein
MSSRARAAFCIHVDGSKDVVLVHRVHVSTNVEETVMKKLLPILVLLAGIAAAHAATNTSASSLAAQKEECFQMHKQLMDKPGVRNRFNCWLAHSYLMDRR